MNENFDYSKTYYIITTKDERVVKDPDGNKWRANNTIFGKKYHINNDFG